MSRQFENIAENVSDITELKVIMLKKCNETEEHSERMIYIACSIGHQLNLTVESISQLKLLAILHDVGKLCIDPEILNKQEELTESEWIEIKKHPETGYRLAKLYPQLKHIADLILHHHERWDGGGYPHGLKGTDIPLLSRIISVADAYDAMTHDRAYRKAKTKKAAVEEICKNAGTQFDPEVVNAFLCVLNNKIL